MLEFIKKQLLVFILMLPTLVLANEIKVTGQVMDTDGKTPMIGATVIIQGTSTGVVTDIDGIYSITAPADGVLVFSSVGYKTRSVHIDNKKIINVKLAQEVYEMDEYVVVAYGNMKKSDLTGSVSSISAEDLMQNSSQTDITSALMGRVAGVNVTATEGGPGAGMNIQIRGSSSINANSDPLYVIDGFPVEISDSYVPNDGFKTPKPSPIANIDPNNIASIEILKDASSTAMYGSRGANGVVLITTKSGKQGRTVVTLDASVGLQTVSNTLDLMDSRNYAEYMWHRTMSGKNFNFNPYAETDYSIEYEDRAKPFWNYETYTDSTNTDWQDLVYNRSLTQNYSLGISGGSEKVTYYVNGSYLKDQGTIKKNTFDRFSLDTKLTSHINDRMRFDISTRLGHTISNGVSSGIGGNVMNTGVVSQTYRAKPTLDPSKDLSDIDFEGEGMEDYEDAFNPLIFLESVTNKTNTTRILANAAFTYKVIDGLSYKASLGTNHNLVKYESFYPSSVPKGRNVNGLATIANNQSRSWLHESILTYIKNVKRIHSINAVAGFTIEKEYNEQFETQIQNFAYQDLGTGNLGMGVEPLIPSSYKGSNALVSALARLNYGFKDRYLFTISGRADGSSRFMRGNRWSMFPSGSFAWRMSEENFMKSQELINNLKFRLSYGVTGNQGIGDYDVMSIYNICNYVFNNTSTPGITLNRIANQDLRWETTNQTDFGIDLSMFNNRLQITMDAYYKKTVDMLMDINVPITTGYNTFVMNYGDVENKGMEFSFFGVVVDNKKFGYNINANISFNRNKVLSLGGVDYIADEHTRLIVGKPIGQFWGYKQIGIIENEEELAKYRQEGAYVSRMKIGQRKFADIDPTGSTDGKIVINDKDQTIIGSYEPKFYGGMAHNFRYRDFSLALQFTYKFGGDVFNANETDLVTYNQSNNRLNKALDFWHPTLNPNSNVPHPAAEDLSDNIDVFVEDGSYLRLAAVTMDYSWRNKPALKKIGVTSARLYLRGNNLFTVTGYSGTDPEANMGGKLAPGVDKGGKPFTRNYSIGINLEF